MLYVSVLWNIHAVLQCGYINVSSYQQCKRVLFSPHPLQHLIFVEYLMMASMTYMWWHLIVVFVWMSLIISGVEHLFMFFLAICMSLWRDICSGLPPIFLIGFFFLYWPPWAVNIFWRLTLCLLLHLQMFCHILSTVFHLV